MTDLSASAPAKLRRLSIPKRKPRLALGSLIAAALGLVGAAFTMAYVTPYTDAARPTKAPRDEDLEGRDPDW